MEHITSKSINFSVIDENSNKLQISCTRTYNEENDNLIEESSHRSKKGEAYLILPNFFIIPQKKILEK